MSDERISRLVRGGYVLVDPSAGRDGVIPGGAVAIHSDGTVASVGTYDALARRFPDAPVEGSSECLVMPGMIDSHSHGSGLSYFELGPGYDHLERWNTIIPTIARPDPYLDTLWCAVKHIRSGCTTIHHMSGRAGIRKALNAYDQVGIRWACSVTAKDQNLLTYSDETFFTELPPELRQAAEELYCPDRRELHQHYYEDFLSLWDDRHTSVSPIMLGPMGPQWCSTEFLLKMRELADKCGARTHMHAVQTPYQNDSVVRAHGRTSVGYLADLGLLGPDLTIGHGVWMSEKDIELLADANVSITHHPGCNLNMRNGILPLKAILEAGITTAIAIDGKGINDDEDIIAEMRLAEKLHRVADLDPGRPPALTPEMLVEMTTTAPAEILGLRNVCGRLTEGMAADIAVVDLAPDPYMHSGATPQQRLVMQKSRHDVRTVIVNGEVLMRDGVILCIDEEALKKDLVNSLSAPEGPRARDRADLLEALRPHILKHYQGIEPIPESIRPFYPVNRRDWS